MKLLFPLDHYDERGRIKPPLFLYVILLFLCRPILLLTVALTMGDKSDWLMSIFYPSNMNFYFALVPVLPGLLALLLVSRRESHWNKGHYWYYQWLVPFIALGLIMDGAIQAMAFHNIQWQFSLAKGLVTLFTALCAGYLLRSRHIDTIRTDWRTPD